MFGKWVYNGITRTNFSKENLFSIVYLEIFNIPLQAWLIDLLIQKMFNCE